MAVVASRLAASVKHHAETAERAINEARRRAETDQLREALIGRCRTNCARRSPRSSARPRCCAARPPSPPNRSSRRSPKWCATETERLNNVIQNLLDATRISSEGLRPRFEWAEVADIVNAAIERRGGRLAGHPLEVDLAAELPLVYVDQVMVEQALGQLLDNAAKYSPPRRR